MTDRPIRHFGDPVLRTVCTPVSAFDDSLRALVRDLADTAAPDGRAAVAAPQIGVDRRIFAFHLDGRVGHIVNPVVVETGGRLRDIDEGCLSVPGLWFPTPRWEFAAVEGLDVDGEQVRVEGEGVFAQMLQHETDHLDGTVYIETLPKERKREALAAVRRADWF
ncbi:peptide deformylase [Brevibacterium jeotgali]|uniref:Peptide deformylase n=1 Tax=Brevibacterium jeotgali TaxID=1262550 RepID=A0A2H1L1P9_9MICO|nr:peptide deformylase [Brevibacterium jeotgali]TWC02809.1 peptide deformylase [Brevibacterium jeotgali]SMY10831.1 peptide deformylase [Brevibacterium jeotgali]